MSTLHARALAYASRPEAEVALFFSALAEVLFFPVSSDLLLVPMVLVNFDRAFRYAMIATAGSVAGGVISFFLGFTVFEAVGKGLIASHNWGDQYRFLLDIFSNYNVLLVLSAGLSTLPFKIVTFLSGFFTANGASFVMAGIVSRGLHYFIIAWLLWRGGNRYKEWIERYFQGLSMVMALGFLLFFVMAMLLVRTS